MFVGCNRLPLGIDNLYFGKIGFPRKKVVQDNTVFLDLVVAIEVGVVLSAFLFMRRMAEFTNVKYVSFDDEEMDEVACTLMDKDNIDRHVSFYEINGPFFFGAADKFVEVIREMEIPTKILILKMEQLKH
jgi:SulP family sulfate permease